MNPSENKKVRTKVIPEIHEFYKTKDYNELDYKEIAVFCAIGFFLGDATYYKNQKCMVAGHDYELAKDGFLASAKPYFNWEYKPRDISFNQAVDEFAHLYNDICQKGLKDKNVILPLSGGLDSRSQAAVLTGKNNVFAYSYKFYKSFDETRYGKRIAEVNNWNFKEYTIQPGYLWNRIEELATLNQCYTDFTSPRQMGIFDEYDHMGNVFFLGHWGDVLFDDMGVSDDLPFEEQVEVVLKKIVKKGGLQLAESLWEEWGLEGSFSVYLKERILHLLGEIKIDNANSRIRAFKSMYWAPRWTSVSLNIFKSKHDIFLPYYEEEMCKFICGIPEKHLAARKIQIEYIKTKNPELAKIPWQTYTPYNLYNYQNFSSLKNFPRRACKKMVRTIKHNFLGVNSQTTRNWEIQFVGSINEQKLKERLFDSQHNSILSDAFVLKYYNKFVSEKDKHPNAHSMNMLLVLKMFQNHLIK